MNATELKQAAVGHLERLAEQLREIGLEVGTVDPGWQPFPALLVSAPAKTVVVIEAGMAHYWRQRAGGDLVLIGPLDEPERAAQAVRKHLTDKRRRRRSPRHLRAEANVSAPVGRAQQAGEGAGSRQVPVAGDPPIERVADLDPAACAPTTPVRPLAVAGEVCR